MKNIIVLILMLSFIEVSFSQQCPSEKVLSSSKRNFISLSDTDSNNDKFGVLEDNIFSLNTLSRKEQEKIKTLDPKFENIYPKPRKIGIERKLEEEALDLSSNYFNVGENYREMLLISPNAKALRLHFSDFHHDVDSIVIKSLYQGQIYRHSYLHYDTNDKNELWTAMLPNDKVYIRIYGSEQSEISIDGLIHIYDSEFFSGDPLSLAELNCHLDVMCYPVNDYSRDAVGQINFVTNGFSYDCTGTVLNDTDDSSYIPYFLTAYHCISTQAEVNSMEVVWLYQKNSCNGSLPSYFSLPRNIGGTLLATSPTSGGNDMTFVRLTGDLPAGVSLSGWSVNPLPSSIHGIHHPDGSWKRYTLMHEESNVTCSDFPTNKYHYCEVDNGITEGGSSGSGLFDSFGYLYGQLYGVCYFTADGDPSCSSSSESYNTMYGKFSETYPLVQAWLQPTISNNDDCSQAISLTSSTSCSYTSSTIANATSSGLSIPNCSGSTSPTALDVWFSFVAQSSTHTIEVDPDGTYSGSSDNNYVDPVIAIYNSCSSNGFLQCEDDSGGGGGNGNMTVSGLNIGNTYYIRVYDYGSFQPANGGFSICVTHTPEDIYLTNVSVSDNTLNCGDNITIYATQNYSGFQLDEDLPNFDLDCYLSTNTTWDNSDELLTSDYSGLGSNDSSNDEVTTGTILPNTPPGIYYVLFIADADSELSESNENNNLEYIQVTISCPSNDIYITNTSVSSTNLNCGESIVMSCTQNYAGNQLDANLTSTVLRYYLSTNTSFDNSDILLGMDSASLGSDDLSENENATEPIPLGITSGTYYILFIADPDDDISETNENNNLEYIQIQISCSYTITTASSPTNGGTTSGGGNYSSGINATVNASANSGWIFTNWTENGTVVSSNSSYQITVNSNRNLVANFSQSTYTINTTSNPTNGGTTSGSGSYSSGTNVTVSANANSGWVFTNWTENGTVVSNNSSYQITVNSNRNLVANFSQSTYTITTSSNPTNGGTTSGSGNYSSGTNVTVNANANSGWTFSNWTVNGTTVSNSINYSFVVTGNITITANFIENVVSCSIPTNITVEMTSPTISLASWDAVSGADYYQVWYRPQGTSSWSIKGTATTQKNIPDLIPYQYYQYKVRARCAGDTWSDFSDIVTVYSNTCDIVTNIAVEMASSTSAAVSWDAVPGADYYQVWYKQQGTSTWDIKGTAATQRNIPDLTPNKYYLYKVRARCTGDIWSDFSEIVTLYSNFCEIPAGITAEMTSPTNAFISWNAVPGADYYQVRYRLKGTSTWTIKGTAATQRNIPNLTPYKYYQYKIRARCTGDTWSDYSDIELLYSSICDIPTGISSVYLDNNRMKIRWDNTTEVKAKVAYREVGTSTWYTKNSQPGSNYIYITGLTPNGQYEYKVRSNCEGTEWSAYSDKYYHNLGSAREMQEAPIHTSSKIYPNPVQNMLNIEFSTDMIGKISISIMDNLGKERYGDNRTIHDSKQREAIDISNLPNGCYFLVISNNEHAEVLKFMKIE
jgi:hypothetical protein